MALKTIEVGNFSAKQIPLFDAITTAAAATTFISGTLPGVDRFTSVELFLTVTATSGTTPTLDLYVQKLCADGATWTDLVHFGQFTTSSVTQTCSLISQVAVPYATTDGTLGTVKTDHIGNTWRIKYVTGGTTPVYTFQLFGSFYE
jgi:hypothetical protein